MKIPLTDEESAKYQRLIPEPCEYSFEIPGWNNKRDVKKLANFNSEIEKRERNVKTKWVTPTQTEEYDIEKVLKELGEDFDDKRNSVAKTKKPRSKSKKKKCKESKSECNKNSENIGNVDVTQISDQVSNLVNNANDQENQNDGCHGALIENIPDITDDIAVDLNDKVETERTENECTICFGPRVRSFVFIPCGHATFCGDCASRIFDGIKKCPTCQSQIDQKFRVFT